MTTRDATAGGLSLVLRCELASCAVAHEALQQLRPTEQREKARAVKMRLKREAVAQLEAQELDRAGLDEFLEDTLGNLPLSVRLCGQMLYASQG